MTRSYGMLLTVVCVAVAVALASPASALLSFVTSRGALGGNDYVDWGVLGANYTTVSNPFSINSAGGLGMNVSKPSAGSFERRDQPTGWYGNFASGDRVIWTRYTSGPMDILFNSAIQGAGAQIQRDEYGSFVGYISAYDPIGNLLGTFSLPGNSTSGNDNSAIFIGVISTSCDVARVVFDVGGGADFAINRMDIRTCGQQVIPEPTALMLAVIGLSGTGLGAGFLRRRR